MIPYEGMRSIKRLLTLKSLIAWALAVVLLAAAVAYATQRAFDVDLQARVHLAVSTEGPIHVFSGDSPTPMSSGDTVDFGVAEVDFFGRGPVPIRGPFTVKNRSNGPVRVVVTGDMADGVVPLFGTTTGDLKPAPDNGFTLRSSGDALSGYLGLQFNDLTAGPKSTTITFRATEGEQIGEFVLYGTDASKGTLLILDPKTGVGQAVGPMGVGSIPSLAVDPTTGEMYAGRGSGSPNIYKVDRRSGKAVLLGDTGLGTSAVGGLDFTADGKLYAAVNIAGDGGTGSDHLATIDKATGKAKVIGPFGTCTGVTIPSNGGGSCTNEGIEGIAFDSSGKLWGSHSARGKAGKPGLYSIDIATGKATFVASILDTSNSPPSGGVVSLQFAGPTLFGGTARAKSPATDGGRLITIDRATGRFAFLGTMGATAGSSLGALAIGKPLPPSASTTTTLSQPPTPTDTATGGTWTGDGAENQNRGSDGSNR